MLIVTNIYLLVCSVFGLVFGLLIMFRKKPPVYFGLVLFSMASQVFTRIYFVVSLICYNGIPNTFNIGFIGFASFVLFLFFANYGQIDMLIDDHRTLKLRYRLIPLIIPVFEFLLSLLMMLLDDISLSVRISYVILAIIAGLAGYLSMKHLIVPDVEGGIVRSIRGYNLLAVIAEVLALVEIRLLYFHYSPSVIFVQFILGILFAAIMPVLNREVKKWTR